MKKLCIFVVVLILMVSCSMLKFCKNPLLKEIGESYKDDNLAEELCEEKIEQWTGLDIDLSPMTPEER